MTTARLLSLAAFGAQALAAQTFVGAPQPGAPGASPVSASEQQRRFSLPPNFEIELVASEEHGVGKPITVTWDDTGALWTITALEYPLDGNEQPEAARALYERGGQDRVLVFDRPYGPDPGRPRVFADNLAMPMGVLPYKDGALVHHGPDVLLMRDTDGDGRADRRETILSGFGIQDSHLMPHQFTRVPGNWLYLAQGAFNYSKVRTRDGREHPFDQTRLARFTVDGLKFEDVTSGPCNIWGLVIDQEGQGFIQEANDYGYPVMALHAEASYPGCTGLFAPYAPYFPSEVDFQMGGTGLSGLALSDPKGSFPGPYANVMFVANPITRKVQAIRIHRNGPWHRYELLPDFVLSSDEWFRPVAIHFGPDGCLYIVDWYNKIISHNEVPRTHPERDKTRGRIWRVRHKDQPRTLPPNIAKASDHELLGYLKSDSTWQMRAAWHQIVDRPVRSIDRELIALAESSTAPAAHRIHALWCAESLGILPMSTVEKLAKESNRNLRREALRALSTVDLPRTDELRLLRSMGSDSDPEVRAEAIRGLGDDLPSLLALVQPSLPEPIGRNPHNGSPMKLREAYDREFERYLIRRRLERQKAGLQELLASEAARFNVESQILACLALGTPESTKQLLGLLQQIDRNPNDEELLRVAENLHLSEARQSLAALLARKEARGAVFETLLKVRNRVDSSSLASTLEGPLKDTWAEGQKDLAARLAAAYKIAALAPELEGALRSGPEALQIAALRALRETGAGDAAPLIPLAKSSNRTLRDEALNSISASTDAAVIISHWGKFNPVQRRTALRALTSDSKRSDLLLAALQSRSIDERDLDAGAIEKLASLHPDHPAVKELAARLMHEFKPVLVLDGRNDSYVRTGLNLTGPFTVETWVRLDPGIDNNDAILGGPGSLDLNFHDETFRVYCGPQIGDRAIARKRMAPNSWTHLAVTRDEAGAISVFVNGELDARDDRAVTNAFSGLNIGWSGPGQGTSGSLAEFRVWKMARTPAQIRADFDRTFDKSSRPAGLVFHASDPASWGALNGGARIEKVADAPLLLTEAEAREQSAVFEKYLRLAESGGSFDKGRALFASSCQICHVVGGQGAQIGPVLNGAAANGLDGLLRAVLTPNAAMEGGYRTFRIELADGELAEGFLVAQNDDAFVLRQPNAEDQRIEASKVRRAEYTRRSLMPEGLLQAMTDEDVRDLFAYLKTLK